MTSPLQRCAIVFDGVECAMIHQSMRFILAALTLAAAQAHSAPTDPNVYSSLGTLSLSSGSVTFNTDTLAVSGGFSATGVLKPQGVDMPDIAVFTFDDVSISTGVTLNLTGSRPIAILSKGDVTIDAAINARGNFGVAGGTSATSGNGGAGKLGGGRGGGFDGFTTGKGAGGGFLAGSGGGFGGAGGLGGRNITEANFPGQSNFYGDLLVALEGGSGGGRRTTSKGIGGGGAGGGAIEIGAVGALTLGQGVDARGGTGGPSGGGSDNYGGGGGSGGGIILHGETIITGGSLNASAGGGGAGAAGGGGGGGGRILLAPSSFTIGTLASFNTNVNAGNNNFSTGTNMVDGEPGTAGTVHIAPRRTVTPTGQSLLIDGNGSAVLDERTTLISTQHRVEAGGALFASAAISTPHDLELAGGDVSAPFGWTMTGEALVSGFGQLHGAVTGGATNVLVATGGVLTVGDTQKNSGFGFAGRIEVGNGNSLNLLDADVAELGFQTTLADTGRLNSLNGVRLGNGEIITAVATAEIGGKFTNDGTVEGPADDGQFLTFTDDVDGSGSYTGNILFSDGFSAGIGASAVAMQNVTFDSTAELRLRIGGTDAGTEHDVLNVSGIAELGGTLELLLVEGFEPNAGDVFDLMNWETRVGTFGLVFLPSLDDGLTWNTSRLYSEGVFSIGLSGDYNFDGRTDAADYVVWRKNGASQDEYQTWRANFGRTAGGGNGAAGSTSEFAIPEPCSYVLSLFAVMIAALGRRSARSAISESTQRA